MLVDFAKSMEMAVVNMSRYQKVYCWFILLTLQVWALKALRRGGSWEFPDYPRCNSKQERRLNRCPVHGHNYL